MTVIRGAGNFSRGTYHNVGPVDVPISESPHPSFLTAQVPVHGPGFARTVPVTPRDPGPPITRTPPPRGRSPIAPPGNIGQPITPINDNPIDNGPQPGHPVAPINSNPVEPPPVFPEPQPHPIPLPTPPGMRQPPGDTPPPPPTNNPVNAPPQPVANPPKQGMRCTDIAMRCPNGCAQTDACGHCISCNEGPGNGPGPGSAGTCGNGWGDCTSTGHIPVDIPPGQQPPQPPNVANLTPDQQLLNALLNAQNAPSSSGAGIPQFGLPLQADTMANTTTQPNGPNPIMLVVLVVLVIGGFYLWKHYEGKIAKKEGAA